MTQLRTCLGALSLIKRFEGLRLKSYPDSGGKWTIGWGHTQGVMPGMKIALQQAEDFFLQDVTEVEEQLERVLKVSLTENQFSALVSLVFNIGIGKFEKSRLLRLLNDGRFDIASNEFLRWNHKNGKVVSGLTNRRKAEKEIFLCSKVGVEFQKSAIRA